jgi:hypothetical protein
MSVHRRAADAILDPATQRLPRSPALMICDEEGRRMCPFGRPTSNDVGMRCMRSEDNVKEVELGILKRSDPLSGLGYDLGIDAAAVERSVARWNMMCDRDAAENFARPAGSMTQIEAPPFYGVPGMGDGLERPRRPGIRCGASSTRSASRSRASVRSANTAAHSATTVVPAATSPGAS